MLKIEDIFSFKAIIFDLDGTLVNSEPLHLQAWNEINEKYNLPLMNIDYMQEVGGISTLNICKMYFEQHKRYDLDPISVAHEKWDLYRIKYMKDVPLHKDIANILKTAKERKLHTAVATGSRLPETEFLLKKHGLLEYLDTIVSSDQVKRCKPAPDTYLTAAMRLNTAPCDCLVFEDTNVGLQGIKAAGMTAIQVFEGKIISDFIKP